MIARAVLALSLLPALGASLSAQTRPNIPPSELPGRERERFYDAFPQPQAVGPAVVPKRPAAKSTSKPTAKPICRNGQRVTRNRKCR